MIVLDSIFVSLWSDCVRWRFLVVSALERLFAEAIAAFMLFRWSLLDFTRERSGRIRFQSILADASVLEWVPCYHKGVSGHLTLTRDFADGSRRTDRFALRGDAGSRLLMSLLRLAVYGNIRYIRDELRGN